MAIACTTIFFHTDAEELAERYLANTDNPCAYLTCVNGAWVFVEELASETADWARQMNLALAMSEEEAIAFSVFLVGNLWALGLAFDGRQGPVAAYVPDDPTRISQLPQQLLAIEQALDDLFPDDVDPEQIDVLFGAVLDGAMPMDDAITEILEKLGCPPDWQRWSWFETVPEQLFIDPDLADRVVPVGEACHFWEE